MTKSYLLAILVFMLPIAPAVAVIETYEFSDPALELRYRQLTQELRCPKCQNQNIADSNAPIAQDLRLLLYQQLESGASDGEILDHMVARYGEFVRYRPSFEGAAIVLWLTPLVLLLVAVGVVILALKRKSPRAESSDATLSAEEQRQLDRMLRDSEHGS
ncbi:MAG: cytochrome c-type biogenesis protein [Pseudomonadota bacterium]